MRLPLASWWRWPAAWPWARRSRPIGIWPSRRRARRCSWSRSGGASLRGSFLVGLCFGLAFFVPLISWLINLAWYAWAALAIAEAVIFALFRIGQRLMLRLPAWPVAVACWWVGVEAFRDRWPYAFPWGRLAMSQAEAPTVRWVAIGGPPLLTFLVALAGTTLAWLLLGPAAAPAALTRRPRRARAALRRGWRARSLAAGGLALPARAPRRAAPARRPRRWPRSRATSRTPGRCRSCCGKRP